MEFGGMICGSQSRLNDIDGEEQEADAVPINMRADLTG